MSKKYSAIANNGIIGLVFGLVSAFGAIESATADSDYKVIAKHEIAMGEWDGHKPWRVIRFYLPRDIDASRDTVLQMNVRSTNKSRYSAIYLSRHEFSMHEFEGCDSAQSDVNKHSRVDYLPTVGHKTWKTYHRVIGGDTLQPGDNYMLVCARNKHGEGEYEIDNFYIKDIVLHYRKHQPAPEFCSNVYQPVCGVDGYTYSNSCEAESARVEIHHGGECSSL